MHEVPAGHQHLLGPHAASRPTRPSLHPSQLLQQGISVTTVNLMIASVALVHNLTLVTNNTADFQNVPGLRLEDWLIP